MCTKTPRYNTARACQNEIDKGSHEKLGHYFVPRLCSDCNGWHAHPVFSVDLMRKQLSPGAYARFVRGCFEKRRYTWDDVGDAILKYQKKGVRVTLYQCSFCGYLHVTSKER